MKSLKVRSHRAHVVAYVGIVAIILAGACILENRGYTQTTLLSLPNPTISSFQATYSNNIYVHGSTAPATGSGSYSYVTAQNDVIGSSPSNASALSMVTPGANRQYAAAVYDTNGTLGTGASGTINFSQINTFAAEPSSTLTLSMDFTSIAATRFAIGFINPASTYVNAIQQPGQGQVSQALPGVIAQVYCNGNTSSVSLDGLTNVACYEPWSSAGGYNYDSTPYYNISASSNFGMSFSAYYQLQISFTNLGNGTAKVAVNLYTVAAMGSNPASGATPLSTLSATITLASTPSQPSNGSAANYDLGTTAGSNLGLLFYSYSSAAGANTTDVDDITLTTPQEVTPGKVLGVNDDPQWTDVSGMASLVSGYVTSNTKFVRIGANWINFQPTSAGTYPTGYNSTYVQRLDTFFQLCAENGIRVLVIAAYAPSWANGGTNASGYAPTSAHYADYAAYCDWLLQRYSPYMDSSGTRTLEAIELWNEPDLCSLFFQGQGFANESPAAGTAYGNLIVEAGSSLQSLRTTLGCSDVQICAPAISDPHSASWSSGGPNSGWIDSFYAVSGVTSCYDIFSFHSYWYNTGTTGYDPPEVPMAWNATGTATQDSTIVGKLVATASYFDPIWPKMVAAGDGAKPIWLTETGAAALSSLPPTPAAKPHSNGQVTYQEATAITADTINVLVANNIPTLNRVYWFRQTEYQGYGLLDSNNTPKLAYTMYQQESKSGALQICAHVANGGFETPSTSTYSNDPTGATWAFSGSAGIQHNGSSFNATQAPEGLQTAFLQSATPGSISQSAYFPAGNYEITFQAAQQSGVTVNPVQVSVNGTNLGSAISPANTSFQPYSSAEFTIKTAGNYTIVLAGTASGGTTDTLIDDVCIVPTP